MKCRTGLNFNLDSMHIETDVSQTVIDVNIKHAKFESSLTIVIDLVHIRRNPTKYENV